MGVLVPVDSYDPKANVQVPINQDLENSIINTDTVNAVLLCEDTSFGSSRTYELLAGAAIPWEHKTCFAILAAPTTEVQLWVTTVSFYFPGIINVLNVNTIVNPAPPPVVEHLLATVPNGTLTATVTIPDTIFTLKIVAPPVANNTCTITGTTTGYKYPVKEVLGGYEWWADITEPVDPQVNITFSALGVGPWYIIGDLSTRMAATQDFADGIVGQIAPGSAIQLGARDVNNLIAALRITSYGSLEVATCASNVPTYGQVNVGVTATQIAVGRAGRTGLTIHNVSTSSEIAYIGDSSVTDVTGYALEPGHSITVASPISFYSITSTGTASLSYEDE
jgi:hypothetical protein